MLVLRGAAALAFGILALIWPAITLVFVVALFAAYAIAGGVAALAVAWHNHGESGWWLVLLLGLVSVAAGIVAVFYPGLTALVLVLVIGFNAIFSGVLDVSMAIRLRKEIEGEWLLALAGIASVIFGALVVIFPGAGALALLWLIAAYAIGTGVLLLWLGLRLRARRSVGAQTGHATH
jgi:uncharacterized membrane protein HdeD (DUF308 family)